ncbi:MAG: tRNA (N(6)-L-threonylcarbamoyladenosine(37)-C(2))-methylthiotransferase MtaB [Bacilli bacterium]
MKFSIITFGCKVNQYESNMMKEQMLHHNFLFEEDLTKTDIVIINTCTVTNTADKKSLRMVRSIRSNYPNVVLVVTGCSTENNQGIYNEMEIDILLGNKDKSKIGSLVENYLKNKERYVYFLNNRNTVFEDMFIENYNHVRAFIKIEDGCDNFCSYCIIPFVRGAVRSKDFDVVIKEAKCLVKNGHKEIVLTGIHTGHYENSNKHLSDLINELSLIDGLERIRLSSIEITELDESFMETLRTCNKLCNHLHIPLQAGSDEILKKMNRKYDLEYFLNKINLIRSIRPGISITTDIIVGHPYETDELFNETLEFVKKIKFSKIHVFPYSKRDGTASAKMDNQVKEEVKKERVKALLELSNELESEYYLSCKGVEEDILIEGRDESKSYGHTSNYLFVNIEEKLEIGKVYRRKI